MDVLEIDAFGVRLQFEHRCRASMRSSGIGEDFVQMPSSKHCKHVVLAHGGNRGF